MTVVQHTLVNAAGDPLVNATVTILLKGSGFDDAGKTEIVRADYARTDANGAYSVDLLPNSLIDPAGTHYEVTHPGGEVLSFVVSDLSGPLWLRDLLVTNPADPEPVVVGVQSIEVGTIITGAPGSDASMTITGSAPTLTLDATIPRGEQGPSYLLAAPSGDTTGATDTPLIQAAITAGGRVDLVPGTYWVNATLTLPSGVTLTGAGKGITILKAAAGLNAPVISNVDQVNGNFHLALKSLTVDGNKTAMTGFPYTGVYLYGCGHVVYEDFEVQNSANVGIYMDGLALVSSRYVWLHNVEAHDNIGSGIQISNATRATHYSGVYAYNNTTHGIFWDASESTADGLYAYNNAEYGIFIRNVFDCVFNNLNATRNGKHGIISVALNDSVGSDWVAIENGSSGPQPGGGWADVYFDPTGRPTWGYGTTKGIVISGVRAGALMAESHNWEPGNIATPTNVPDYGIYIGDGINGNVTLRDVMIGSVGVQGLRVPAASSDLVVAPANAPVLNSPATMFIKDDFAAGSTGSTAIGELGWSVANGGLTVKTVEAGHPGIFNHSVTTSGQVALLRLGGGNDCDLVPSDFFDAVFIVRLNSVDTATDFRAGIGSAAGTAPPPNGVWIEKAFADTSWFGVTRAASAQSRTTALSAVTAGAWARFRMRRVDAATVGFSVNDGAELTLATNIPTAALAFFLQISNNNGATKNYDIDYFEATVSGLGR